MIHWNFYGRPENSLRIIYEISLTAIRTCKIFQYVNGIDSQFIMISSEFKKYIQNSLHTTTRFFYASFNVLI